MVIYYSNINLEKLFHKEVRLKPNQNLVSIATGSPVLPILTFPVTSDQ